MSLSTTRWPTGASVRIEKGSRLGYVSVDHFVERIREPGWIPCDEVNAEVERYVTELRAEVDAHGFRLRKYHTERPVERYFDTLMWYAVCVRERLPEVLVRLEDYERTAWTLAGYEYPPAFRDGDGLVHWLASEVHVAEDLTAATTEVWESYRRYIGRGRWRHPMGRNSLFARLGECEGVRREGRQFVGIGLLHTSVRSW